MKKKVIISFGSNNNKEKNIGHAKSLMAKSFDYDIKFSPELETEPIGITSGMFTNCIAIAYTDTDITILEKELKEIERLCGDTADKRARNIVEMDIDILKYDNCRHHDKDWNRPYIKTLLGMIE